MVTEQTKSEVLEKLDEIGADGLGWLQEFSSNGIGFIEEQAPEVCSEIITLGIVQAMYRVILSTFLIIMSMIVFYWGNKWFCKKDSDGKCRHETLKAEVAGLFFSGINVAPLIISIVSAIVLGCAAYDAITIWVAPRLYLLEYFTGLASELT